jgi:DNA-binding NarL/FixJ family response regulator
MFYIEASSDRIQGVAMSKLCNLSDIQRGHSNVEAAVLTRREQQVVYLVCKGLSNKLVARTLHVSEGTIKAHLHAIFRKLGVQSRFSLVDAMASRRVLLIAAALSSSRDQM